MVTLVVAMLGYFFGNELIFYLSQLWEGVHYFYDLNMDILIFSIDMRFYFFIASSNVMLIVR